MTDETKKWFINQLLDVFTEFRELIRLSSTKRHILIMLAHHANKNGFCWPSYQTIAIETGYKRRAIIKHITEMETDGILTIKERYKLSGDRDSNGIQIHLHKIVDNSQEVVHDEHHVVHDEHQGDVLKTPGVVFYEHPNKLFITNKETTQEGVGFILEENEETKAVEEFAKTIFGNGILEEYQNE